MHNKKASMELSVNSIVILVIAIVMMGLILGFIRTKFNQISPDLTTKEPDATAASAGEPITLSSDQKIITAGDSAVIKVNVYNGGTVDNVKTHISVKCTPNVLVPTTVLDDKTIAIGAYANYLISIKTVKTTTKDTYLCTVSPVGGLAATTPGKDFTIKVQ